MYNKVYEAIYLYIKEVVENMEIDTNFSKEISIEVFSYRDNVGLLIKKISSSPLSKSFINGDNELLFKFAIESIQNYIVDDNNYMIELTQFLDNVSNAIKVAYDTGNKPIIEGFESVELIAITNSSNIELTENKVRSVIDLEFKYLEKKRRIKNG